MRDALSRFWLRAGRKSCSWVILHMPAMVAYSRCKAFASFVQRLKTAGKPPKVTIVALMRKLVAFAHAIIKSEKPFDSSLHGA